MTATITSTGETFPLDSITETGVYLVIGGWPRFFAASLLTVN